MAEAGLAVDSPRAGGDLRLAVGIYYIFTFLQRSRGWPVVLGFLILIGITTLIALLELQVLRWLLQQLFLFTTVAILIIFQPSCAGSWRN